MSYDGAVRYLFGLLGGIRKSSFGLERMQALVERLGHPERAARIVHVAGTNGKGSTCAFLEAGLRAAGYRTGLSTSPHLVSINERFRIDGSNISNDAFSAAVAEVREANEALLAEGGQGAHPTFFESAMAVAFCAFRAAQVDWAVIETGLGGRLDASNVVQPEVAVITPIGLDHERFLGSGLAVIAREKAGIFKPGSRVVFGAQPAEARATLESAAQKLGLPFTAVDDLRLAREHSNSGYCSYQTETPSGQTVNARLGLAGQRQVENSLAAVLALDALGVDTRAIESGLRDADWPGRLQLIPGEPDILLDAAHNPAGSHALAEFLREHHPGRPIRLIFGASRDKAIEESAEWLFPLAGQVILTRSLVARGVRPPTLHALLAHLHEDITLAANIDEALAAARSGAAPGTLIVIAGTLFLVGEALLRLQPERYATLQPVEG